MHSRPGAGAAPSSLWWLPLAAVAGGVAVWQLASRLSLRGGRRGAGGRWVRDRSLGGKMVFIPDAELPEAAGARKVRPLYEDPDDGAAAAAAAEAEAAAGSVWATASGAAAQQQASGAEEELPGWWDEPRFLVYTTLTRKEELQRQARLVLRELQDAKLQVRRGHWALGICFLLCLLWSAATHGACKHARATWATGSTGCAPHQLQLRCPTSCPTRHAWPAHAPLPTAGP